MLKPWLSLCLARAVPRVVDRIKARAVARGRVVARVWVSAVAITMQPDNADVVTMTM